MQSAALKREVAMKVLKWLGLAVLILIVVVFIGFVLFLNAAVKAAVEVGAPEVLGVPVTVGGVSVQPLRGKVIVKELTVGNPEGFKSEYLFKLGELDFELDTSSLGSDTILIKKIHILKPQISYEQGLTGNNISALLNRLEKDEEKKTEAEEKKAETTESETKVVIESFLLDEAQVRVSAKLVGDKQVVLPLPPIELKDIGKESEGASLADIITRVIRAVLGSVTKVVTGSIKLVGDGVGAAADVAGDTAGAVGGAAVDGVKAVGNGAKGLFKKAGGLIPGKDKD